MTGAPKLTVIIVTWNVRDYTLACLDAVRRETAHVATEIIVVDNASTDGTAAAVQGAFPEVLVLTNAENVGFPAANNQALARAAGDYVLFLNPDTEVGRGAIAVCLDELERDPGVGVSGCKLVLEDGSVQLECARNPYLLQHLLTETLYLHMLFPGSRWFGHHRMSYWDHEGVRDVEAICGAFMLARTAAARSVGGLPDDVFMYHEDLAFCLRLRRAGWRIRYRGDVSTLHRWRASSRGRGSDLLLLEGIHKLQLIREAQGRHAAAFGRAIFAFRCALRLLIAGVATALPAATLRHRFPRVFDARAHALQLAWTLAPGRMAHRVPLSRPVPGRVQAA
jgi:GT2 family glycosyltransferase